MEQKRLKVIFRNCTLSIITCNLLMGQNYTDWTKTNFSGGDTVTITYTQEKPVAPLQTTITANGNLNVIVKGSPPPSCAIIACYSTNASINGTGFVSFTANSPLNGTLFSIANGLTVSTGISVSGSDTAFHLKGGTLTFDKSTTININGGTAIKTDSGTLNLNQNDQGILITGKLDLNNTTSKIKLSKESDRISGSILTSSGKTELSLSNSSQVLGDFRGNNSSDLNLTIDNSTFSGNIQNEGNSKVEIKNKGKLSGTLSLSGTKAEVLMNKGSITGSANLTSTTNTLKMDDQSIINNGVTSSGNQTTITLDNQSQINGNSSLSSTTATLTLNNASKINGGINTEQNGTSTITLNDTSSIQNGTSNFSAKTTIIFENNSQAKNENFNIKNNAVDIIFKENSQMIGGTTHTSGGNANITFENNTQATSASFETQGGQTKLIFKNDSKMNGGRINTSGGTANITFENEAKMDNGIITTNGGSVTIQAKNNSKLSNTITQYSGISTTTFSNNAEMNGNIFHNGGTANTTFENASKMLGNITQNGGTTNTTFKNTAQMIGSININGGTSNILFQDTAKITGDINAKGTRNTINFKQGTLLDGNLRLDGTSTATFTQSKITKNVESSGNATVTLDNTSVEGYFQQDGGELNLTMQNQAKIQQGFKGIKDSQNNITMKDSTINQGISQNTGKLNLYAKNSTISEGFIGINSDNHLKIVKSTLSDSITQTKGSLKGELVEVSNLKTFTGTNSDNLLYLLDTKIQDVSQSGGGLEFRTNAEVSGNITGEKDSNNKITIIGANVEGNISQNTGSMNLELNNVNIKGKEGIKMQNATFHLQADGAIIHNKINLKQSTSSGIADNLILKGQYFQQGGNSNFTFSNTEFQTTSLFFNSQASLIFTKSTIDSIFALNGNTNFNLADSTMKDFTGFNGSHSVTLVNSKASDFTQDSGALSVNASNQSTISDINSSNTNLTVSLDHSTINKGITNRGNSTTISMQDSTVGNKGVTQIGGNMFFNAESSKVQGRYTHIGGTTTTNFTKSSIELGADLRNIQSGNINLNQQSQIKLGLVASNSNFSFTILDRSMISGGFNQTGGNISGTLNSGAEIQNGLVLQGGTTHITLFNKSKLSGDIIATNHITTIILDDSEITGNITATGGKLLDLTAQNGSKITSDQTNIRDTDLKLTLDTSSKFIGNLDQTNNKQDILIKENSVFEGNINNNDTISTIAIHNATLAGSLSQTGGTLGLDLSNKGIIKENVTLEKVNTTLSGSGMGNEIGGDFTQNGGSLRGAMNGLTLKGKFKQTTGSSEVIFTNSTFKQDTEISFADSSSLTFIQSALSHYKISGGENNTLKLLNQTTMTGNLTLSDNASVLLKMQDSTLNGSINGTGNSILTLDTLKSNITGNIDFNTGGILGQTDSTNIGGNINLTNTNSNISFTNQSQITGNLTATDGRNTIKFNASRIKGNVSATGGEINLDLSNASSIGGNLNLQTTTAHLTGSPANNQIKGNFTSTTSTLTGDMSSLTLSGKFTQTNGSSDIIFRQDSLFKGAVSITDANPSNINFIDNSGIENMITITRGENKLSLQNQSFIKGDTTLQNGVTTINVSNQSSILGTITANETQTTLNFDSSTLNGNISQTKGNLSLSGANQSFLTSNITLENTEANISLRNETTLSGTITGEDSTLTIHLDNSSFNTKEEPLEVKLTNSDLSLTAKNNSIFGGNLTQTNESENPNTEHTATLDFSSNSIYSGTMEFSKIKTQAKFNNSSIFSESIKSNGGSLDLSFDHSKDGGVIESLETNGTLTTITTNHQSHITITEASISGSELFLSASQHSKLMSQLFTLNDVKATYNAHSNGNINVNTKILDDATTLVAQIEGGILQGAISQINFNSGEITLQRVDDFGGRWAITDDSQIKNLKITNDEEIALSSAIFGSVFNNPLTFVDFTLDFNDTQTSSRVGKEIIEKPPLEPNQPLPPAGERQTYVRQLRTQNLEGNHGLFRVYADLGNKLADNILANTASGNHIIQIYYRADTFREIGDDRIVVAKVADPNTQVSFKGTQSEIGLRRYSTEIIKENAKDGQGGFEWIIGQAVPAGLSYGSKIIASILQSQYRSFFIETDSLDRRLGGLENIQRDKGFWVRSFVGQASKDATNFSTSAKDFYYSIWGGFDYNSIGLTGHNFLGGFFNYSGINIESKDYLGKISNFSFGIYNVFKAHSGFYFDLLAKYIYSTNAFEIYNYSLAKNKPNFGNHKFLANFEMGYTFYLGEKRKSSYIQPQFQITSGMIQGVNLDFIDVTGEKIHASLGHNAPVIMRFGAFWGKEFGEKIRGNLKIGSSLVYDVNSGGELNLNDSSELFKTKLKGDFRLLLSAYGDIKFGDNFRLYSAFDTSFFGSYNTTFNINFGMRFVFGKRNNVVYDVPMVYNPYEQTPIINNKRIIPVIQDYTTKDIDTNYKGKRRSVQTYIPGNYTPQTRGYTPQPITRHPYRDESYDASLENQ